MAPGRLFLTGATGYSGQSVLRELNRRGIAVTALVRDGRTLTDCETVAGDLATVEALAERIRECAGVIHLASPRSVSRASVAWLDVRATREIALAWRQGAFVYPSHATVYGVPRAAPLREDHPTVPTLWYDAGKVAIERDLRAAGMRDGRGPAILLRPSLIFAVNDRRSDRQLFGWVYRLCRDGATFVFDSDEGLETYGASFVGEDDYARAVSDCLALTAPGTYHLASGFCTWRELIRAFDRELGRDSKLVVRRGARARGNGEVRLGQSRTELDTSAFARATGFAPRQTLEELVERFVSEGRRQPQG